MNYINSTQLFNERMRRLYRKDFAKMEAEAQQSKEVEYKDSPIEKSGKNRAIKNKDSEPSVGQAKDDEEYKKLVKKLLKKYGVDEIEDLTDKQKKNFFAELDEAHTSDKEEKMNKSDKKVEKSFGILGINDYISSINQQKTEDTMKTFENDIEKGKKANVGEIREWKGQKYQKQAGGTWKPVSEGKKEGKKPYQTDSKKVKLDAFSKEIEGFDYVGGANVEKTENIKSRDDFIYVNLYKDKKGNYWYTTDSIMNMKPSNITLYKVPKKFVSNIHKNNNV